MSKEIIVRKVGNNDYTVTADGKVRSGFTGINDAREFVGAMQAHGLFPDYGLFLEKDNGKLERLEPTYNEPFKEPVICQFG